MSACACTLAQSLLGWVPELGEGVSSPGMSALHRVLDRDRAAPAAEGNPRRTGWHLHFPKDV